MGQSNYRNFELICRILEPWEDNPAKTLRLAKEVENADWEKLLQLADGYFVSPALYVWLKRKECIKFLDNEVSDCLEGIYELNRYHNKLLKSEAVRVIRILNSKQVRPVLLKGMASLMTGLYEDDGERIIGDIDLLIGLSELAMALKVLLDNGYSCDEKICDKIFNSMFYEYELTLITESGSVKIDLHVSPTGSSGEKAFISTQDARKQAEVLDVDGARFLLPSPLFRLMHNFYHAQYLDRSYLTASINLRQLIDWVKLWQQYDGETVIPAMKKKLLLHRQISSFQLYIFSAERYLALPMPVSIKIGWYEKLLFQRQNILMQYRSLSTINSILVFFLSGAQLIAPERLRLTHGNLPLWRLITLRIADLFDPGWYRRRVEDIKRMF